MENNIPHHVTDSCIAPEVIWFENHNYEYFEYEFDNVDDFLSFLGIEDDDN